MYYEILTASGQNKRSFQNAKKALEYYESIKHTERTELCSFLGLVILPADIYSRPEDRKQADTARHYFMLEANRE